MTSLNELETENAEMQICYGWPALCVIAPSRRRLVCYPVREALKLGLEADLDRLYAAVKAERGTLDIVFANAGAGTGGRRGRTPSPGAPRASVSI